MEEELYLTEETNDDAIVTVEPDVITVVEPRDNKDIAAAVGIGAAAGVAATLATKGVIKLVKWLKKKRRDKKIVAEVNAIDPETICEDAEEEETEEEN